MADRQYSSRKSAAGASFLQKLREHSPNSAQLIGFATLAISGGILLVLTGITLTTTVLGLIFVAPLIVISSPIWIPVGILIFIVTVGLVTFLGFVAALSWLYRYFRGLHPPGSDRIDRARTRFAGTASHAEEYATEYGWYLQGKVKDAAPSA